MTTRETPQLPCQSVHEAWMDEARRNPDVALAFRLLANAVLENHREKLRKKAEEDATNGDR
jgi:hypothetical protein